VMRAEAKPNANAMSTRQGACTLSVSGQKKSKL